MESKDSVRAVVLAGKQGGKLLLLKLGLELGYLRLYLLNGTFVLLLDRKLDEGDDILQLVVEFIVFVYLTFQRLSFLENFLGIFQVVPEAVLCSLLIKLSHSVLGSFNVQNVGKLLHFFAVAYHFNSKIVKNNHGKNPFYT